MVGEGVAVDLLERGEVLGGDHHVDAVEEGGVAVQRAEVLRHQAGIGETLDSPLDNHGQKEPPPSDVMSGRQAYVLASEISHSQSVPP